MDDRYSLTILSLDEVMKLKPDMNKGLSEPIPDQVKFVLIMSRFGNIRSVTYALNDEGVIQAVRTARNVFPPGLIKYESNHTALLERALEVSFRH